VKPHEDLELVAKNWKKKLKDRKAELQDIKAKLKSEKKDLIKVTKRLQKELAGFMLAAAEPVMVRPRVWDGTTLLFQYNCQQKAIEVTVLAIVPPEALTGYNTPIPLKWYIKYWCNSLKDLDTVVMVISTWLSSDPRLK